MVTKSTVHRIAARVAAIACLIAAGGALAGAQEQQPGAPAAQAQPETERDLRVWSEFVSLLRRGAIGEAHVRPAYASTKTMLQFLATMRASASWEEWERQPEVFRVDSRLHFVAALSERGIPNTYSFTFLLEDGRWFLEHFEAIVLRLDRLGPPPLSTFPDIGEDKKAWMRQEKYWSQMIALFRTMRRLAGTEAALGMLHDGAGYLVEAKTWVPFHPPARALILYLCWEQSRLHGNGVTLERLTDTDAVVVLDAIYLRLYRQSAHMRELLTEQDYRAIFETIWRDRGAAAGWAVEFTYQPASCTLRFYRDGSKSSLRGSVH